MDASSKDPVLSVGDRQSALWMKIKRHLEERIAALRARNDSDLDDSKTAKLRGRIAEAKHLAALDKPAPRTEAGDEHFD